MSPVASSAPRRGPSPWTGQASSHQELEKSSLANAVRKGSIRCMNAAATESTLEIEAEMIHRILRGQLEAWFGYVDRMLDVHRSAFVFREATAGQLGEHKRALERAIRYSLSMSTLIEGPDFNDPKRVSRLRVRIQQLKDAYATFHDPELSDGKAEEILKRALSG